jgi:alpha-L-fucosidase 2
MWLMGLAWSCQDLWVHYLFNEERQYLQDFAYPVMKEAADFCCNWLVVNPKTKELVSGPSISPGNRFKTTDGQADGME